MSRWKHTVICCPANVVTGGPEALHQLCSMLNRLGQTATMYYFDAATMKWLPDAQIPPPYVHYDVLTGARADPDEQLWVVPELWPNFPIGRGERTVWWLGCGPVARVRWSGKVLPELNFAQSEIARVWLERRHQKTALMLSDYISNRHFAKWISRDAPRRERRVLYNPARWTNEMTGIMEALGHEMFTPIQGMDRETVCDLMDTSLVYLDLGRHWGKDRMPREAALHGCAVILGGHGDDAMRKDHALASDWWITPFDFESDAVLLIQAAFKQPEMIPIWMNSYVEQIIGQEEVFKEEVRQIWEI